MMSLYCWWVLNVVIRMSQNSDKSNNQQQHQEPIGKIAQQISKLGPPMLDQIMDKLTGTNTSITYLFENFEIDIPDIQGPKGQQHGSGKFSINGSIRISTELHNNKNNEDNIAKDSSSVSGSSSNTGR